MNEIIFYIYFSKVVVRSKNNEILERISGDFTFFLQQDQKYELKETVSITIEENADLYNILPKLVSKGQNQNCITYVDGLDYYYDYFGKVLCRFNYQKNQAFFWGKDIHKLHEVIYLFILSRSGKMMDLNYHHKLHASALVIHNRNCIFMLPSKGGKTTLMNMFSKNIENKVISDDTPVLNREGQLLPFLLRVGFETKPLDRKYIELKREHFGVKYLVSMSEYNTVAPNAIFDLEHTMFFFGKRANIETPKIIEIGKIELFKEFFVHGIIGVGLPMIIEYFIKGTLEDHLKNFKILFSRIHTFAKATFKSRGYKILFTYDPELNAQAIDHFIKEKACNE